MIDAKPSPALYQHGYPGIAYSHRDQGMGQGSLQLIRHFVSNGCAGMSGGIEGNLLGQSSGAPTKLWHKHPSISALGSMLLRPSNPKPP
ncbi:MAG: hypothetical protein VYA34_14645 [Myxococcota bacterium]|nr:hypothetical protein [Myxococcota bacterium]